MEGENILISKLNEFTRKYYKNKIIRGTLISLGILLSIYLAEILLEYFSYFPSLARIILFFLYITVSIACLGLLIIVPFLKYLRLGKTMSRELAADIIGKHFTEIGDKLLNTLQLIEEKENKPENIHLLLASIEQRTKTIRPIPFTNIIRLKNNFKYLKYVAPPLLFLVLLLFVAPSIISDPTLRLIHYNRKFEPPALFRIVILNKELKTMQQDDFFLRIGINGNSVPEEVFVKTGISTFPMKRENKTSYSFVFKALQADTRFTLFADDKETQEYTIAVYPKPIILNFETRLEYPAYTLKPQETLKNIGDFIIPEGTMVNWNVYTRDVSSVKFRMPSELVKLENKNSNVFSFSKRILESATYSIFQENAYSRTSDSLKYSITVVKDAYPEISLKETADTTDTRKFFFQGVIKDDYGFTKLLFILTKKKENDTVNQFIKSEEINIEKRNPSQVYFYALDLSAINMDPGDKYSYYFEIWDNDGIRGPKASRTAPLSFEIPSIEKLAESTDKNSENIERELNKSLEDAKNINRSIDEINRKMIDQNDISWKEKKKLEEFIKQNERIIKQVDNYREQNQKNINNGEQYLETSERILEKQKKLNELANQLLTDEMKKTIQELRNLLNQMDKSKLSELLPKMKEMSNNLEQELDRNLQLFKQIEFERKLDHNINQLKKLAEEQKKLSDKTIEKKKADDQLSSQQKAIKDKYDTIQKGLEQLQKVSKELENPPDLKSTEESQKSIDKKLSESEEQMKSDKMKDASKTQKDAADEMDALAQKLDEMQNEAEEETQGEDATALKLLLQDLNKLSFQQEDLIYRTMNINRNDPKYLLLIDDQKLIEDKFKTIEDTLDRIARREVMLKSIIVKEVNAINNNVEIAQKSLVDRVTSTAMTRQQYAMTGMNNLALLLDEALKQLKDQMENGKSSGMQSMCKKPGKPGGKKKMNSMTKMQEELNKSLEKMKQGMNKSKDGQKQTRGEEDNGNKEIARLAAQQEQIREALQEYANGLKEQGINDKGNMNSIIEDMEKNEKDILNKRINQETLNRQQKILSRMLESEKAEEKRDKEEKRESTEAKNQRFSNPEANFEYKKNNVAGKDLLNFTPAPVNLYYRTKASEYIIKIGK